MTYADLAIMDLVFRMRDPNDSILKKLDRDQERRELSERSTIVVRVVLCTNIAGLGDERLPYSGIPSWASLPRRFWRTRGSRST